MLDKTRQDWVALAADLDIEARAFIDELRDLGESPWLYRHLVAPGRGELALIDPDGTRDPAALGGANYRKIVRDAIFIAG